MPRLFSLPDRCWSGGRLFPFLFLVTLVALDVIGDNLSVLMQGSSSKSHMAGTAFTGRAR
jgi:hypothetical protein